MCVYKYIFRDNIMWATFQSPKDDEPFTPAAESSDMYTHASYSPSTERMLSEVHGER